MPTLEYSKLDCFSRAYLEACDFTLDDDARDEGVNGFHASCYEHAKSVCDAFQASHAGLLERAGDDAQNGHDLWLTRNRHGAGFWDRGYEKTVADALTNAAHALGEVDAYAGDDGFIYIY